MILAEIDHIYKILGAEFTLPLSGDPKRTKEIILMRATILFACKGYDGVSIKDLANEIGIKPASLYNHFESKRALWEAVVEQAKNLYLLYFQMLDKQLQTMETLDDYFNAIFDEPKKMTNMFPCFAFSLIRSHRFSDELAGKVSLDIFYTYSIDFICGWYSKLVERGLVRRYDVRAVSMMTMSALLDAIDFQTLKLMGRTPPCEPTEWAARMEELFRRLTSA
ncbi:hypothetical protein FACS1894211_15430 [Clostridia bacterium]|nr:hypothetical protein FACS1894211_15430 [Clostridia bacterium]